MRRRAAGCHERAGGCAVGLWDHPYRHAGHAAGDLAGDRGSQSQGRVTTTAAERALQRALGGSMSVNSTPGSRYGKMRPAGGSRMSTDGVVDAPVRRKRRIRLTRPQRIAVAAAILVLIVILYEIASSFIAYTS